MASCNADKILYMANFTRNLPTGNYIFFVLFNLKNPGIQVKTILATGYISKGW